MHSRRCASRILVLLAALAGLLPGSGAVRGEDEKTPRVDALSARYERRARLQVPVEEISGWAPLPASPDPTSRRFLAVSDEGVYRTEGRRVEGALFALEFAVADDVTAGSVSLTSHRRVTLSLGTLIPRLDPAWAGRWSLLDLEACVPLPGTPDLFLLAGERNPEDITDGGANRLYVVRYPAGDEGRAELLAYLRVPDLGDDTINDRFEAAVALPGPRAGTWSVFAMKERTAAHDHPPVYLPALLVRDGAAFRLDSPFFASYPLRLPALLDDRERLGSQADACLAPDGHVWVLDRWRREVQVARRVGTPPGTLEPVETLDAYDVVSDVPGERAAGEPAAPGSRHPGYGRHEAMCFDAQGWLWLAADLGGGTPSVVTVLAPREGADTDAAGNGR